MIDRIFIFLQLFLAGLLLGALLASLLGNNAPLEIFAGVLAGMGAVAICRKSWLTKTDDTGRG